MIQVVHAWSTRDLHCLESYTVPNKLKVIDLDFDENKVITYQSSYPWGLLKYLIRLSIFGIMDAKSNSNNVLF